MVQLKERAKEILKSNKFSYLDKAKMFYSLGCCVYYSLRGRKTKSKLMQDGYDRMFLSHWVTHKKIFYKPTK